MKVFFSVVILSICFLAKAQSYRISFDWRGLEDQSVMVGYHSFGKKYSLDTLAFNGKGKAVLEGSGVLLQGIYFLYTPTYYFEFVVKEQDFSLSGSCDQGYEHLKIKGSPENEVFRAFQLGMAGHQRERLTLLEQLKTANKTDSVAIQSKLNEIQVRVSTFQDSLIAAHPARLVSAMVSMIKGVSIPDELGLDVSERSNYVHEHYFDMVESPYALMRTPVFKGYVARYFERVVPPIPDSLILEIDQWLDWCRSDESTFDLWLQYFLEEYQETEIMGFDQVWIHLIERYCLTGEAHWLPEKTLRLLAEEVQFIKPNLIGNKAPDFQALDTLMRPHRLNQFHNKYLVLFFYDPDCGHCKKKVPLLNQNHEQIKALGGEIVGVCTTTNVDRWKEFIHEKELHWIHLADPYGRSDFRVNYNTRTTPQLYVLDAQQKIIAKKLDPEEQLINFLERYEQRIQLPRN
ncbi:redoxin domain-containing protein [Marinoscillum sp. MHG1-6]|uniref:redoxin domain-containing protein n=1 Tax=Marinoscillum sp. MHG1-6 TaxID=2959627 RepID=UPI0021575239|nr:redoxin domain-containing protein [Marinoscillum sp. MHG1-6]